MPDNSDVAILDFPLRGTWTAMRTPATRVPSHGTDFLGQRFAFDFVQPGIRWLTPFGPNAWQHAWLVAPVTSFRCWNAPVFAAEAGRVLKAFDGWPDRRWVNALWQMARVRFGLKFRPIRMTADDWRPLCGNYVVTEGQSGVCLYAHLRQNSIIVREGDDVAAGAMLGTVGNSGNSAMPHLHFHLMDRFHVHAMGRPCAFRACERRHHGRWIAVPPAIPRRWERLRPASHGEEH